MILFLSTVLAFGMTGGDYPVWSFGLRVLAADPDKGWMVLKFPGGPSLVQVHSKVFLSAGSAKMPPRTGLIPPGAKQKEPRPAKWEEFKRGSWVDLRTEYFGSGDDRVIKAVLIHLHEDGR